MSDRVRAGAALAMLAAIGALFVYKYAYRVTGSAGGLAAGYAVLFVGLGAVLWRRSVESGASRRFVVAAGLLVAAAVVIGTLWPEGGRLARLPALEVWWERVFAGVFPYGSPIRPSGFPGLFGLVLPFYLAGLTRYLPAAGLAVFALVAAKGVERPGERVAVLATVAALPATWYEVLLQSELFFNVSLALLALIAVERLVGRALDRGDDVGLGRVLAAGGLLGLVLSTRLIVALLFGMYFVYRFRGHYARGLGVAAVAMAGFVLTLAPLLLWDAEQFLAEGPFAVQGLYLPTGLALLLGGGALVLAARARTASDLLFRQGAVLFGLTAISLGLAIRQVGVAEAVLASGFDLTYFVFCIPLLVLSLACFTFGTR